MINSFQKKKKKNNFNKISQNALFFWCQHLLLPKKVSIFQLSYCLLSSVPICRAGGNPRIQAKMKRINPNDIQKPTSWGKYLPCVSKWHSPLPYFGTIPLLLWHSLSYKVAGAMQVMSRQGYCMSWSPPNKRGKAAEWSSWKKLPRGQIHDSKLNSLQALKPSDFPLYCTERLSEILTIILLYKCFVAQNDPNTNFDGLEFWCTLISSDPFYTVLYPQPNCSKQSYQGTVQSQLFQPCRQLLVWDHRGRHDIAWPSWDWEGVPNETRSKLQTNWQIYEARSKWIATA